ncbi:MAG TPA: ABC transporter permease subunit [Gemmatimonadaceae bacterium]|nr:ABC transporter permease subunit [Gemmatimonadaceae bacterium]
MRTVVKIAGYGARDLLRSRWLLAYAGFFAVASFTLLRFSDGETKALLSLVNVVLLIVPLASVIFGTMYLYAAREFVELLLAQPIRRRQLFAGLFAGLSLPTVLAVVTGLLAPMVIMGVSRSGLAIAGWLAFVAAVLSIAFTAIAAAVAYFVDDRVRGLAAALGIWLLLAVVYDAAVLMAAVQLSDYPLERPLLAAMFANPIDLSRLLLLQQFDTAALLGYTGALFQRFLAGAAGGIVAVSALAAWIVLPTLAGARLFQRKDF